MPPSPRSPQTPERRTESPTRRLIVEVASDVHRSSAAAYGALVREAQDGLVLSQVWQHLPASDAGVVQVSGLIAGLELAVAIDPGAELEVRTDSREIVGFVARHEGAGQRSPFTGRIRCSLISRDDNRSAWLLVEHALSAPGRRGLIDA